MNTSSAIVFRQVIIGGLIEKPAEKVAHGGLAEREDLPANPLRFLFNQNN
jgi:hypothetical protein